MIEFALLFGLGFLSALLMVMILAPAVHRRVVRYTENRLKATMPISPAEVRAQRDMARAVYAAENARTKQDLIEERDKAVDLQIRFDKLAAETSDLHAANHELQMQVNDMSTEAADLRSRLRREEGFILQLKESLALVENTLEGTNDEAEGVKKRIGRLQADIEDMKITLATRDTEIENMRFRTEKLREERQTLRTDVKLLTARAKDAETRLQEEERRAQRLDEKLAREIAAKVDLATRLERREDDLARLQGREKPVTGELWQPVTGNFPLPRANGKSAKAQAAVEEQPASNVYVPAAAPLAEAGANGEELPTVDAAAVPETSIQPAIPLETFAEDIRNRAAALSQQLPRSKSKKAQDALRRELATIAADMVALTAAREGEASPIHALLDGDGDKTRDGKERTSLATRARSSLSALRPTDEPA